MPESNRNKEATQSAALFMNPIQLSALFWDLSNTVEFARCELVGSVSLPFFQIFLVSNCAGHAFVDTHTHTHTHTLMLYAQSSY